jgi:hypothetical protein
MCVRCHAKCQLGMVDCNWLGSHLRLAKALFQLSDPDPRYANVTGNPVDNLWADLDFGTLTYMYYTHCTTVLSRSPTSD